MSDDNDELYPLRKPLEERRRDAAERNFRLGGVFGSVNYTLSYARASLDLLETAIASASLDELGMPIFYLQRHTYELALKDVIDAMHMYRHTAEEFAAEDSHQLAEILQRREAANTKTWKTAPTTHDLERLLNEAHNLVDSSAFGPLPSEFDAVAPLIRLFEEKVAERSRYRRFKSKDIKNKDSPYSESVPSSIYLDEHGNVVVDDRKLCIPLGEISDLLQAIVSKHIRRPFKLGDHSPKALVDHVSELCLGMSFEMAGQVWRFGE